MKNKISSHWIELFLGFFFLFLALYLNQTGISNEISWIIGVFGGLISISIIIIKLYIKEALEELTKNRFEGEGKIIESLSIINELESIKQGYSKYVLNKFHKEIKSIAKGVIKLTPSRYYVEIIDNIKEANIGSVIYAINSINEIRWSKHQKQLNYLDENVKAADRGVQINRIFIIDKERLKISDYKERLKIIKQQSMHKNINVSIVWSGELNDDKERVRDWVLFNNNGKQQLYVAETDHNDGFKVDKATLYICDEEIKRAMRDFKVILNHKVKDELLEIED